MAVLTITKDNFDAEVVKSNQTVLVDFWATWCGPCSMMGPIVDEIAAERPDVKVGKINVDNERDLAKQFRVLSIPTLGIVTYVGWIFGVTYPPCLALLVLGILSRVVPNDGAYKGSVYLVTVFAFLESFPGLSSLGFVKAIVAATPLSTYGFGWIIPFIIGFVGGAILYKVTGKDKLAVQQ